MQTKDGCLRKIDDRSAHHGAEDATVADSETAAGHILNGELVVASLWCKSAMQEMKAIGIQSYLLA